MNSMSKTTRRKGVSFLLALLVFITCQAPASSAEQSDSGSTNRNRDFPISEVLLYQTSIRDVDRTYRDGGVAKVIGELKNRALGEDAKALRRLFEIFFTSDGYVTEVVLADIGTIYTTKSAFVLRTVDAYDSSKRDLIYKGIIFEAYYGQVFSNEYPSNVEELKTLGKHSRRFLRMYDYYLKNPEDIENWSVDPPE